MFASFDWFVFLRTVPLYAIEFSLFLFCFAGFRSTSTLFILFRFGGFRFSLLVSLCFILYTFHSRSIWFLACGKLSI